MEKSGIFVGRPILDSGHWTGQLGTVDSGQMDCPVVGNGTLDGPSCTGQGAARGRWTVDAGQVDSGRDRVDRTTVLTLEY